MTCTHLHQNAAHRLRSGVFVILAMVFFVLGLTACSPGREKYFFASKCQNSNLNCADPNLSLLTSGGKTNLSAAEVVAGTSVGTVVVKPIRYDERTAVVFTITNTRLVPLRNFSFDMTPGGAGYTYESSAADDCGAKLALIYGAKCDVTVSFTPGVVPPDQIAKFKFKTLLGDPVEFESGLSGASIISDFHIDPASLVFPDTLAYAQANAGYYERDLIVLNHGSASSITSLQYALSPDSGSTFSIVAGGAGYCTAGQSLAANGGSCKLKIRYKPESSGLKRVSLILSGAAGTARIFTLSSNAKGLIASAPSLSLGSKNVSSAAVEKTVQLTSEADAGGTAAESCSYSLSGSGVFSISANTCTASLASGASCNVTIRFTPDSSPASHVGTLSAVCDSRGGQIDIPLAASTTISPILSSATSVDFGETLVGSKSTQTVTFTNQSGSALTNFTLPISSQTGSGLAIESTTCAQTLAAGQSCAAVVSFSPTTGGLSSASVAGTANEGSMDPSLATEGQGVRITASLDHVDFGTLVPGADRVGPSITIINPSKSQTASGCSLDTSSLEAAGFSVDSDSTCKTASSLNASSSCTLKTRFNGVSSSGTYSANAVMTCEVGGSATVALQADVSEDSRLVVLPPARVNFTDRLVGVTVEANVTFSNAHASSSATGLAISLPTLALPWSQISAGASDCSSVVNLTAGSTCDVRLRYHPLATLGAEQVGDTSGVVSASANGGATQTPNVAYTGRAVKITPSMATLAMGSYPAASDFTSPIKVFITNPSPYDDATGCVFSITAPFTVSAQTCTTSLAKNESCSFSVTAPSRGASIDLSGTAKLDCAVGGRAQVAVTASAKIPATLAWSGTAAFGGVDPGQSLTRTFTLTHAGLALDAPATGIAVELASGSDSEYSIVANNCPSSLSPGSSCTVSVRFSPTAIGATSATLRANATSLAATDLALSGDGADSSTRITPSLSSVTFSNRLVGATAYQDITLSNNSGAGNAENIATSGVSAPYSIGSPAGACGSTLADGASCTVRLVYAPVSAGSTSGTLSITGSNIGAAKDIAYTGSAVTIATSTSSVAFGTIDFGEDATASTVVTVSNPSASDTASGCSLSVEAPFVLANSTCGATIATSSSCSFQVRLSGQTSNVTLSKQATMTCTVGGTKSVGVTATVDDVPNLSWLGAPSPAFGNQDVSDGALSKTFTLKNNDVIDATLSAVGVIPATGSSFTIVGAGTTCSASTVLHPGDTCAVVVSYDPSSVGAESASLRASITSPAVYNWNLGLTGTGTSRTPAHLTFSSSSIDIGPGAHDQETLSTTYTIENTGEETATGVGFSFTGTDSAKFSKDDTVASSCGVTIAGGATCNIRVKFTPSSVIGTFSAQFAVSGNQAGASLSIPIRAASAANTVIGANATHDEEGIEGDLVADSNRFYLASRKFFDSTHARPLLTVCSKTAKGAVDTSACTVNDIGDLVGAPAQSDLAGELAGSGPRVAQHGAKIFIALQNKDTSGGMGGDLDGGTSTVIVCQKPTVGNTIAAGTCHPFVINSASYSGQFPSIVVTSNKVVVANTGANNKLLLTACDYDSAAATAATTLTLPCGKTTLLNNDQGWYTSMGFNGTRAVVATFDKSQTPQTLKLTACSIDTSINTFGSCSSLDADSVSITEGAETFYSGAYPSLVLDGNRVYVAHQQGESKRMRLRLTNVSFSGVANAFDAATLSSQYVSSVAGTGATPRIAISGSGTSGNLWLTASTFLSPNIPSTDANLKVWKCALTATAPTCSSAYAVQTSGGVGPLYSRSVLIDTVNRLLIAPFLANDPDAVNRNGLYQLGLWPEL